MSDNRRILELLEHLMDSGQSPEEVCSDCPEMLAELKEQWEQCRRVDERLDALFGMDGSGSGASTPDVEPQEELPRIPGYHILGIEGRGGVGIVYRARHIELNRIIALKMLLAGSYAGRVERARFLREARAVASLRHPNIVQVYDVGEFEGRPFFTMELVEGKTLAEFLGGNPQPATRTVAMMLVLANATEYAHQNRIIHRDLKPSNVLMTTEGTLKISDFGLARQLEGDAGLTFVGARLGTPSYMAPEQALGKEAVGPLADVYSLGAILYEMLTGRPPFRGETAAETERQLLVEDAVPPSRLNARVPRDLETICLKCLHKDALRRYPSAAHLEQDLSRFQRGEPVLARKAGTAERTIKWVRRHPTVTTGIAGSMLILCLVLSVCVWWISQRASMIKAVNEDLQDAIRYQQNGSWANANLSLDHAAMWLGDHGPADLQHRLELARQDSQLVERLEKIRLDKCRRMTGDGSFAQTDRDYAAAFKEAGLGTDADPPAVVADRISHSVVRQALLDALDDWAICLDDQRCVWIIQVAELADPEHGDPNTWRSQVRNTTPELWFMRSRVMHLVDTADVEHQSVTLLMGLTSRYVHAGGDPIDFLKRIQEAHPADFWANFGLANYIANKEDWPEAIRYYQAAIAAQPDAALVHHNLGKVLSTIDRSEAAIAEYEIAVKLNPADPTFQAFLAIEYRHNGQYVQATPHQEAAVRGDPANVISHYDLGDCYLHTNRDADAGEQFRLAIGLKPNISKAQNDWRNKLIQNQWAAQLRTAWQLALQSNPQGYDPREGYAELCLFVRANDRYQRECAKLLQDFGDSTDPVMCASIGTACMLAEQSPQDLARAVAMVNRAVAADPNNEDPPTRLAHGLAEYRLGHHPSAVALLEKNFPPTLRPSAQLIAAMAQFHSGNADLARKTLVAAVHGNDWTPTKALTRRQWMAQVLRREAEKIIPSN